MRYRKYKPAGKEHYPLPKKSGKKFSRVHFLGLLFVIFAIILVGRLFSIQVLQHGFYAALAEDQHGIYQKLFPKRGEIFVKDPGTEDLYPITTNIDLNLIYAVPKQIEDQVKAAKELAALLELNEEDLLTRLLKKDDVYEPLKHNVADNKWEQVKALNLRGIAAAKETARYYPEGEIFSQITGFVGYRGDERIGQYGMEGYFDNEMKGKQGFLKTELDAGGRWITIGNKLLSEAKDGDSYILTLDRTIQSYACDKLAQAVEKHGADEGSLIIMNPNTGAIMAMCNTPAYDSNKYSEVENIEAFVNSAITDQYEPGSVFKAITMAAALDSKKVTPSSTYNDEGKVKIDNYTIQNSDLKTNGEQTMTNILEKSLNTGAIYAVQQVGNKAFYNYVQKFGFGKKTGIELEGETGGNISSLNLDREIYSATASYGQGITVTPIQLITAYSAIANGGKLMKPYLVDSVVKENGFQIKTEPEVKTQVISPETSRNLSAMLVSVVRKGHAQGANIPGYFVMGKTGTAQIARKDGVGYESGRHNDTFIGAAPVTDPVFAMLVKINDPKDVSWAEGSVVPLFGDIGKFIMNYLKVPPDDLAAED